MTGGLTLLPWNRTCFQNHGIGRSTAAFKLGQAFEFGRIPVYGRSLFEELSEKFLQLSNRESVKAFTSRVCAWREFIYPEISTNPCGDFGGRTSTSGARIDIMLCRRQLLTSRAAAAHILFDTRKPPPTQYDESNLVATNLDRFGIYLESTARLLRDLPHHAYRFRRSHRSTAKMEQDDS